MSDTLRQICDDKREHITKCKQRRSESELTALLPSVSPPRGFQQALISRINGSETGLIAEIKKASPSRGLIREDFDPATIATAYAKAGATCLSVLTDIPYFQGADHYLQEARNACKLPVLRKDFMLDPYQVLEARALGADCILLIMAALTDQQASELEHTAREFGMDILVEVHNHEELERALQLRSTLLGINNRNLKTLEVSLKTSEILAARVPEGYTLVCESGIHSHADIQRMQQAGMHCFLVGESLMRQPDIEAATRSLLGG